MDDKTRTRYETITVKDDNIDDGLLGKVKENEGKFCLQKKNEFMETKTKNRGGKNSHQRLTKKRSREKVSESQVKEKIRAGWRFPPGGAVACLQMQRRLDVPHPVTIPFTKRSRVLVTVIGWWSEATRGRFGGAGVRRGEQNQTSASLAASSSPPPSPPARLPRSRHPIPPAIPD